MTINQRLDEFLDSPQPDVPVDALESPTPAAETAMEPVQVAGIGKVKELIEPLLKRGARASPEPKVTPPDVKPVEPPPAAPAPKEIPPALKPGPTKLEMPSLTDVQDVAKARQAAIDSGQAAGKPPAQAFNTEVYDNEQLAATVNAVADHAGIDYSAKSIRSIYQEALAQGVPEDTVRRLLQGVPMNSTVGDNGLALNTARVLTVWDESGKRLDGLFQSLADGKLDDAGKMDLRRQLAIHEALGKSVKGFQVDVARTMNVFKRVRDAGPGLDTRAIRDALDTLGTDGELLNLAEKWLQSPTKAGKNALIERGMGGKAIDAIYYTAQSNLLNDPVTWARNAAGIINGPLQVAARAGAVAVGRVRTLFPGTDADRYRLDDLYAMASGTYNGFIDGLVLAGQSARRPLLEGRPGLKADAFKENPLTAEFWSGVPASGLAALDNVIPGVNQATKLGKTADEIWRTPDLKDTPLAKAFDGLAALQAIPFRILEVTDDFVGGLASRVQLHYEAHRFLNAEYDKLVASGVSEADAMKEVQRRAERFLTERPADMQASIEGFRQQVTFQTDLTSYLNTPTGPTYNAIVRGLDHPALKWLTLFNHTLSNVWIEGTSWTPGMNFISPRFYQDWNAGGAARDLAVSRVAMGGATMLSAAYMTWNNRLTGYGPSQTEDRNALMATGWRPYAARLEKGELSAANVERLSKILPVTTGEDGSVYVQFNNLGLEPLSFIFGSGADVADAAKFHTGGPSGEDILDNDAMELFKVGALAASNYVTNLPFMQAVGNLARIMRSRQEDKGDQFVEVVGELFKQVGTVAVTGMPVVGMGASTLTAHIERMLDPRQSNTMPPVADVEQPVRAFYEVLQRYRSRVPGLSKDVPPLLDSLGREKTAITFRDYWVNWTPATASPVKDSPADETLASIQFGISMPSRRMGGVAMSAEQYNRYLRLYGQEIRIEGMNLEEAIPVQLKRWEEDSITIDGTIPELGDKQNFISSLVAKYRDLARFRLIGDPEGNPLSSLDSGLGDERIEFPDLRRLVERNAGERKTFGR